MRKSLVSTFSRKRFLRLRCGPDNFLKKYEQNSLSVQDLSKFSFVIATIEFISNVTTVSMFVSIHEQLLKKRLERYPYRINSACLSVFPYSIFNTLSNDAHFVLTQPKIKNSTLENLKNIVESMVQNESWT